ncbi:helix-turn-helix domain-containing protein [Amycolatopsis sp. cmx-11-12]|uniref:helix-turn-helix domain-containing protein n=1 Tax=Amycolatopsis sp. cmx-11-12 TaxID=2785795 RepID=UPI003916E29F
MSIDDLPRDGIGRRVRAARKLAGITQDQLAQRAHVSLSLVKQVEQGKTPASAGFTAAAAQALGIAHTDLTEQPYPIQDRDSHRVHSVIPALRREIASYLLPPEDVVPRSMPELEQSVQHVSKLRHSVVLDELGVEVPGLLAELRAKTYISNGREQELTFGLLAEAYAAAGQVAYKLGYVDLSSLTTERFEWAAEKSGDPLAMAAGAFYRAGELINSAEWRGALTYLEHARAQLDGQLRGGEEAAHALYGALHLKSGLAAARAGDTDTSETHLGEARQLAAHVTPGSDYCRLAFDRDNVAIWSVGLAVERRDGTEAVKRASEMQISPTTPGERVGHHWIDLARGFQLHGDRARSLQALQLARQVSPQQTRYHPHVRETVITLAEQDRRRSETLAGFARWANIKI